MEKTVEEQAKEYQQHMDNRDLTALRSLRIETISFTKDKMVVLYTDGREVSVPLVWYPRLAHGTQKERENYELWPGGEDVYWPDFDENVCAYHVVIAKESLETEYSFEQWKEEYDKCKKVQDK